MGIQVWLSTLREQRQHPKNKVRDGWQALKQVIERSPEDWGRTRARRQLGDQGEGTLIIGLQQPHGQDTEKLWSETLRPREQAQDLQLGETQSLPVE